MAAVILAACSERGTVPVSPGSGLVSASERQPGPGAAPEPSTPPLPAASGACNAYCAAVEASCNVYVTQAACLAFCATDPWAAGVAGDEQTDTLACRTTWALRAADSPEACENAGVQSPQCTLCDVGPVASRAAQSCATYCGVMERACPGQLGPPEPCLSQCEALGLATGTPGSRGCNTLACRITWAIQASGDPPLCRNASLDSPRCNPPGARPDNVAWLEPDSRRVIGLYDGSESEPWMQAYRDKVFSERIRPALQAMGLELELHDVHGWGLPKPEPMRQCLGVITVLLDPYLEGADAYVEWLTWQIKVGRKVLIINDFGAYFASPDEQGPGVDPSPRRANRVLEALGVRYESQWTNDRSLLRIDNRGRTEELFEPGNVEFAESPWGPHYYLFRKVADDVVVHLWVNRRDIDQGRSAVVFTSGRGGMALTRYYDAPDGKPFMKTDALLRRALGHVGAPE